VTPDWAIASSMFGTSPPGSITAARLVASHQISVQFCSNGVTGMMAARAFGCTVDWVCSDMPPHCAFLTGGKEGNLGALGRAGLKKALKLTDVMPRGGMTSVAP
jgi:hypothetical protein